MSTRLGTEFGDVYGETYAKLLAKWSKKLKGVNKLTDKLYSEWGADLHQVLGDGVSERLSTRTLQQWHETKLPLPGDEVLGLFVNVSVKGALASDARDLLERLRRSVAAQPEAVTAAFFNPSTLILRAAQTVAQIFDMAMDRFNNMVGRFLFRRNVLTGRRRWVSTGLKTSRHSRLHGQVKGEGESFTVNGETVSGPRPPGGSPAQWSNCSCYLEWERSDGSWVRVT